MVVFDKRAQFVSALFGRIVEGGMSEHESKALEAIVSGVLDGVEGAWRKALERGYRAVGVESTDMMDLGPAGIGNVRRAARIAPWRLGTYKTDGLEGFEIVAVGEDGDPIDVEVHADPVYAVVRKLKAEVDRLAGLCSEHEVEHAVLEQRLRASKLTAETFSAVAGERAAAIAGALACDTVEGMRGALGKPTTEPACETCAGSGKIGSPLGGDVACPACSSGGGA